MLEARTLPAEVEQLARSVYVDLLRDIGLDVEARHRCRVDHACYRLVLDFDKGVRRHQRSPSVLHAFAENAKLVFELSQLALELAAGVQPQHDLRIGMLEPVSCETTGDIATAPGNQDRVGFA